MQWPAVQVERGIDLVYGGGSIGLMGSVSHAVHAGGRHVMGLVSIAISLPSPSYPAIPPLPFLFAWVLLWTCGGLCMPWRSLVLGSAGLGALFPGTNSLHQNSSQGCRNASFISSASQLLGSSGRSIARWGSRGQAMPIAFVSPKWKQLFGLLFERLVGSMLQMGG